MKHRVKIKRMNEFARIPSQGSDLAAGFDLYSPIDCVLEIGDIDKIPLGFALEIPAPLYGEIYPRSGMMSRGLTVFTAPIDRDYRGQLHVVLANLSGERAYVERGDRIAQLLFRTAYSVDWVETDELSVTGRGDGGFGSSGK